MEITKMGAIYFSPTGSTKYIVRKIMDELPFEKEEYDITPFVQDKFSREFRKGELAIIGIPVFSGRVPGAALSRLQNLKGNHTPAVLVAVYGNRNYDDALLELKNTLEENGFIPLAAGAFIAEHSIARNIAVGRPNSHDLETIAAFGKNVAAKIAHIHPGAAPAIEVKGSYPYRKYESVPIVPKANNKCNACGTCANECPTGAIPKKRLKRADKSLCMGCMRCVYVCPQNARDISSFMKKMATRMILKKCDGERQPKIFI